MQIYSKHKDYYDGQLIQISSLDSFVRQAECKENVAVSALPQDILKLSLDNRLQYLFFCGVLYPFIENTVTKEVERYDYKGKSVSSSVTNTSFLWTYSEIKNYLQEHDQLSFCFEEELEAVFHLTVSDFTLLNSIQLVSSVCYFVYKPHHTYRYPNRFDRSAIAGNLLIYPSLQDIQAYKILDPYTVAQQIDYWLGNIFVSDNCPSLQTNNEKIVAYGHDLHVSFRDSSGKGKKKNARKSN